MFGIRKMLNQNGPGKALIILCICFTLIFTTVMPVTAAATKIKTGMIHNQPEYFVPAYRIQLDVHVSDPAGINLVRCYFKAAGEADFVFVPMDKTGGSSQGNYYSGILPAPSQATKRIEYLFLAVNNKNSVVKSQSFILKQEQKEKAPAWQNPAGKDQIKVSMELDKVPSQLRGFTDNIVMNQVESGARFGVVAGGLYYLTKDNKSHTSGKAASAQSGGTITAKAAGYSTKFLVGAGIVGAAAVGIALSGGGGGGGGGGGTDGGTDGGGGGTDGGGGGTAALTSTTIVGYWNFTGTRRDGVRRTGNITFNSNGSHSYSVVDADGQSTGSGSGSWSLSGTDISITFSTMSSWFGTVSGDSQRFVLDTRSGSNHGVYTFTR